MTPDVDPEIVELVVELEPPRRTDGLDEEVCLLVTDGSSLVVGTKPDYPSGCFRLPSGGKRKTETPAAAAAREVLEELGVTAPMKILGRITYRGVTATFTTWVARAHVSNLAALTSADDELSELRVMPIEDLHVLAESLEALPETEHRGTTWNSWGRFRAVSHRFSRDLLAPRPTEDGHNRVHLQVLGDVRATRNGTRLSVPHGRATQVLTALAVSAPNKVSQKTLAQGVWGGTPDASTIQGIINILRKALGDETIKTAGSSYYLDPDEVDVDASNFMRFVGEGRFAEAHGLWSGDPRSSLEPGITRTVIDNRMDALRDTFRRCVIELVELRMEEQDHRSAISLIQQYLVEAPEEDRLNEGLIGKLAIAMHFDGRRTEALRTLRALMTGVRDELGAEPSPEINELFAAIMGNDPTLQPTRKASLRTSGPVTDDLEMVMYWGYRPAAHSDIRAELIACRDRIVIAGQGLSTITEIVSDPNVQKALAAKAADSGAPLQMTFVFAAYPVEARESEEGGRRLRDQVTRGLEAIKEFRDRMISAALPVDIEVRTYRQGVMPRHFFLQSDATLYVGSYLSHKPGSRSYLMKLSEAGHGFYALFSAELTHVLSETVRLDIRRLPEIITEEHTESEKHS